MDEINSKLDALRKKYPDQESQEVLADWEKNAKIAVITANLQENDAIKIIISQYQKELASLDKILITDASLFKDDDGRMLGLMIHERKKWYQRFLTIFTKAESQVQGINNGLDNFNADDQ